jgi:sigma-E factor negative regulatory protein RseC
MKQEIEHSGIIESINGQQMRVQIVQMSACSSCHAKGACSAADMDEKYIDVESNDIDLKVGDAVNIYGQSSMGLFAVLLAFVLPFILILLSLIVANNFTKNEGIAGTISLAVLIPYFAILSLFNNKLKRKLKFYIRKQ